MSDTQWHNPENVSADLLPKGYRFLTKEEFRDNTNGWKSSRRALLWRHGWSGPSVWTGDADNTYCVPIAAMPAVGSYGRTYQQPGEVLVDAKELAELREEVKKLRAHIKLAQWAESHDMAELRAELAAEKARADAATCAIEQMPTCRCGLSTDEQCSLAVQLAEARAQVATLREALIDAKQLIEICIGAGLAPFEPSEGSTADKITKALAATEGNAIMSVVGPPESSKVQYGPQDYLIDAKELAGLRADKARADAENVRAQHRARQLCAMTAERDALAAQVATLTRAGNAMAEYLAPGPIPADQPTERDFLLASWNEAASAAPPDTPAPTDLFAGTWEGARPGGGMASPRP